MSITISPQEYRDEAIRMIGELLNTARGTCFEELVQRRLDMMKAYAIKLQDDSKGRIAELERENAALREAKDAYFKHNNILVELMTEEQKKKALEILMSRPKEAQP